MSAITKAPEMLSGTLLSLIQTHSTDHDLRIGRVKTLHPAVHAGILARDIASDEKDLSEQNIAKIDYVVCNLYPFKETIAKANV